ncbi:hypothetical protein BGW38_005107 [Lunasporangiospora selenospora]|uniref:Uncharacterized protein n=1 Tax=Lunasporangiospora selenospora TaxID=979761 RepID=A0A9P6FNE8_9FUNG|nr:hypothetical protein BGW38_005107 [Lunasporangiospora selenospora]
MTKIKSFDRNSKAAASNLAACPPLSLVVNSTVGRSSEASPTATTPVSPIPSGIPAALQKLDYVPKTTYIPASAKDRSQKFKEPLPSSFAAKKNQQQPQQDKTMVFYDKPLLQPLTTDSFLDDSRSQLALVPAVNSETESNPPPFALLFPLPPSFMRPPIMGRSYSAPENASPPSPLEKEIKKDSPQTPLLSPGLDTPILGREDWSWKQQGMNEKRCSLPIEPKTTTITSTMSTSQAMIMAAMAKAIREGTLRLDLAQVPVDTDGTKGSNDCQGGRRRSRSLQKDFGRRGCLGHCPSIGLTAHSLPRTYGYF